MSSRVAVCVFLHLFLTFFGSWSSETEIRRIYGAASVRSETKGTLILRSLPGILLLSCGTLKECLSSAVESGVRRIGPALETTAVPSQGASWLQIRLMVLKVGHSPSQRAPSLALDQKATARRKKSEEGLF